MVSSSMLAPLVFVVVTLLLWDGANGSTNYKPRFSSPNDYDLLTGEACGLRLPSRNVACPQYGLRMIPSVESQWLTQAELEAECTRITGHRCAEGLHLFPNGACESCPEAYPFLKEGYGGLWCEDASGERWKDPSVENVFDCVGGNKIPRVVKNKYRSCYAKGDIWADVPEYYKADDLSGELTMASCQKRFQESGQTEVFQNHELTVYNMSVVYSEEADVPHGFLQCPKSEPVYDYTTLGWMIIYYGYGAGFFIILAYVGFKAVIQRQNKTKTPKGAPDPLPTTREATDLTDENSVPFEMVEDVSTTQTGYKKTLFGTVAWLSYWCITWSLQLIFLLISMDVYGLLYPFACTQSVKDACAVDLGYSWRSGIGCGASCVFGIMWSSGTYEHWPYQLKDGGIQVYFVLVIALFPLMLFWWASAIVFYQPLTTFFYLRSELSDADIVVCSRLKEKDIRIESDSMGVIIRMLTCVEHFFGRWFNNAYDTELCKVHTDDSGCKYFTFRCLKYTYNQDDRYILQSIKPAITKEEYIQLGFVGLTNDEANARKRIVGENRINYDVPRISEALWTEFFTLFYLYQIGFTWLWFVVSYFLMALLLNIVIISAGCISMFVKRSAQFKLRDMSNNFSTVVVFRDGKWEAMLSVDLVPGDVVKLHRGDYICMDAVLTSGRCVMNESSLTGEPTPVPKLSLSPTSNVYGEKVEDMKYTLLCGTVVESVSIEGGESGVWCVVTATGPNTQQGRLVRSMIFPPRLRFKFDDHFRVIFGMMLMFGVVLFLIIYWLMSFQILGLFYGMYTISNAFSPLIPAILAAGQAKCSNILKKSRIHCMDLQRIFVAGKIKTFCLDKTGTITKQGMEYYGFCRVSKDGMGYEEVVSCMEETRLEERCLLGVCHEVTIEELEGESKVVGNEVDVAMFEASGFRHIDNCSFMVQDTLSDKCFRVVKRYEFSRDTMMMTSVAKDVHTGDQRAYVKGSFEKVASRCVSGVPKDFELASTRFARQGYYVLGVGHKSVVELDVEGIPRDVMEQGFHFDGLLLFKNDLKPDSVACMDAIREGGVRIVMVTGDNVFTACSVGSACGLSDSSRIVYGDRNGKTGKLSWVDFGSNATVSILEVLEEAKANRQSVRIAVSGKAFDQLLRIPCTQLVQVGDPFRSAMIEECHRELDAMRYLLPYTTIFARMKPEQKVEVVRLQMEKGVTGMCGDGANDAAALRIAHCGVALATGGSASTIVAPFSTEDTSLRVVVEIIRQSRAALATAFAGYKRLIMSGQIAALLKLCLYHFGVQISEITWMVIDGVLAVGMALCLMQSRAAQRLTPTRPTSALLGLSVVVSIVLQVVLAYAVMVGTLALLYYQPWFQCKNFDMGLGDLTKWWTVGDNFESCVISVLAVCMTANMGFIFNYGFEYRNYWFKNYWLVGFWAIVMVVMGIVVLAPPNLLSCLFRINCGDESLMAYWNAHDWLSYSGNVPLVPSGCPCTEQLQSHLEEGFTCESEYIDCTADQYNQVFHHTLFPQDFRSILVGIVVAHFVIAMFLEWFVMFGPVRHYLRKRKVSHKLQQQAMEMVVNP